MTDTIRAFIIESVQDMDYSVEGIGDGTELGSGGVDIAGRLPSTSATDAATS
jgi:hypothetical protein